MKKLQYAPSIGNGPTYDIEISRDSYEIFLDGKSIKQSDVFAGHAGGVTGEEALIVWAKSYVEELALKQAGSRK